MTLYSAFANCVLSTKLTSHFGPRQQAASIIATIRVLQTHVAVVVDGSRRAKRGARPVGSHCGQADVVWVATTPLNGLHHQTVDVINVVGCGLRDRRMDWEGTGVHELQGSTDSKRDNTAQHRTSRVSWRQWQRCFVLERRTYPLRVVASPVAIHCFTPRCMHLPGEKHCNRHLTL